MKTALLILAATILLAGCETTDAPPLVAVQNPAALAASIGNKDATISGAAVEIKQANRENPNPPSQAKIDAGVVRIETAIAAAPAPDLIRQIDAMAKQYNDLAASYSKLRDDFAAYKNKAEKDAYLWVVKVFAAIGAACFVAGLAMFIWTTYKHAGIICMVAGPVIGGSGLLWGKPWFTLTIGIGAVLIGLAIGIKHVWAVIDARKETATP
jgi:hypothetical protein